MGKDRRGGEGKGKSPRDVGDEGGGGHGVAKGEGGQAAFDLHNVVYTRHFCFGPHYKTKPTHRPFSTMTTTTSFCRSNHRFNRARFDRLRNETHSMNSMTQLIVKLNKM